MTVPSTKLLLFDHSTSFLFYEIPSKNRHYQQCIKGRCRVAGQELKKLAEGQGLEVVITEEFPAPEGFLQGKDACFVIGGDGTLLGLMEQAR